jgi:hypothetical protein
VNRDLTSETVVGSQERSSTSPPGRTAITGPSPTPPAHELIDADLGREDELGVVRSTDVAGGVHA